MGQNDRAQSRAEQKRNDLAAKRLRRAQPASTGVGADWATANGDLLGKAIAAIAGRGGALRLGYTRDGGAYAIGIYGDGDPFTEYCKPDDDIDEYLKGVIEDYGK